MKYKITHITTYTYSDLVPVCQNVVRLTPRSGGSQRCLSHRLVIKPRPDHLDRRIDYFGNLVHQFAITEGHSKLQVKAVSRVEVAPPRAHDPAASPAWETVRDGVKTDLSATGLDARQFVFESPHIPLREEIRDYTARSFPARRPILEGAIDLMRRIHTEFAYDTGATTIHTPIETVFRLKRGVCQDFAHLMLGGLRSLGLPARYVSGYLRTIPLDGKSQLTGSDASHAWVGLYCGPLGWIELDPTNNLLTAADHITIAWGRDFSDVSPISGMFVGGGQHVLTVGVAVEPIGLAAGNGARA